MSTVNERRNTLKFKASIYAHNSSRKRHNIAHGIFLGFNAHVNEQPFPPKNV